MKHNLGRDYRRVPWSSLISAFAFAAHIRISKLVSCVQRTSLLRSLCLGYEGDYQRNGRFPGFVLRQRAINNTSPQFLDERNTRKKDI